VAVLVAEVYFLEKVENIKDTISLVLFLYPNVAKAGGLQSQGVKGEVVVVYRKSLTTQDLESSGFPAG
jgi:hypothetical protein